MQNESVLIEHIATADEKKDYHSYVNKTLINTLDEGSYFKLEPETITALDILPRLKPDGSGFEGQMIAGATSRSNTTVYEVLNKCRTSSGKKLLAVWLQHPLSNKEKIDLRLDIVQYLVENTQLRNLCHEDFLRKIPDLLRIAYLLAREKCNLLNLMKMYNSCKAAQDLCRQSTNSLEGKAPEAVAKLFHWIKSSLSELGDFIEQIETVIDVDSVDEAGEYLIKPDSDENVAKLTLELSSFTNQARRELKHVADDVNLEPGKSIKLEIDSEKGFALKVTKVNEQAIRGNEKYQQLTLTKRDGYRFTNKALTKLSDKYVMARQDYNEVAKIVVDDMLSKVVMYDAEVQEFSMAVTVLDTFVAMAVAALCNNNYNRPLILGPDAERIRLDKIRHPCVENQPDIENYVPNDVNMNKDDKKFYIITGPNMGGKSTFIKSVAIAVIMAQCGSLIPADDASISVVDNVFTRVGAGDKQMEGISTFMEEMMDMSKILEKATKNSFVIIDELGRGTSTFDGFGLASAITKHLAVDVNCFALFATHFHELTEMEEEFKIIGNLHVKAICESGKLTMLYDIGPGVCLESYGINVAEYTGFPEHVVQMAKDKLRQFEEVPGFSDKKELREFVRSCVKEMEQA